MEYIKVFATEQERESALAQITHRTLSVVRGTKGIKVAPGVSGPDYSEPFYIDVRGTVTLVAVSGLQVSTDKTNWTDTAAMTLPTGKTYFRVATDQESPLKPDWTEDENSDYDIGGNINSLVKVNFSYDTTCYTFYATKNEFFRNKAKLKSAGDLILPATTLVQNCYNQMFYGCTSLTTAPALPATKLADSCYKGMFSKCSSLTTTPVLPATTLAQNCYNAMFWQCTSLTTAPVLPATTLVDYCYANMFSGCTSLTTAPVLPATTLAQYCYQGMFSGCTSLTTAPVLPATTLAVNCYESMFADCTSLTTVPALPATTLAVSCYNQMFNGCTSLSTVPATLPATTLATNCYQYMFWKCSSLTTAPELPATTLANYCYYGMFKNCTNLNYIKCLATDLSPKSCTYSWTSGVAATGTFVKDPSMSSWPAGNISGIPSGWTVEDAA